VSQKGEPDGAVGTGCYHCQVNVRSQSSLHPVVNDPGAAAAESRTSPLSPLPDATIKHLELLQPVISRMGQNSFAVKGWAVTVVAGFIAALATQVLRSKIIWAAPAPVVGFWLLDAYYLRLERQYRNLYEAVRRGEVGHDPFCMDASRFTSGASWWSVASARSIVAVHASSLLAVVGLLVWNFWH